MFKRVRIWADTTSDAIEPRPRRGKRKGHMTLLEYFNTPETVLPQELIYGVTRVADAPFVSHQRVVLKFAMALHEYAERAGGEALVAPTDVVLDSARALVVQPDVVFVSRDRLDLVADRVYGAPDVVVEVLSPRPRIGALEERVNWFAEYGVREIWLYNQVDKRLDLLQCSGGKVMTRARADGGRIPTRVLPGFDHSLGSMLGW